MLRSQCPERKYGKEEEAGERQYDANPKALPDHRNKNYACVDQTIERQEERDNPRNRYLALESQWTFAPFESPMPLWPGHPA